MTGGLTNARDSESLQQFKSVKHDFIPHKHDLDWVVQFYRK